MRILSLEAFNEAGQLRSDDARQAAVLARLGRQRLEAAVAVAYGPLQQGIGGDSRPFGIGKVVVASGNLLGTACEFAARKTLND